MIAPGPRQSGLDIPFLDTDPVPHDLAPRPGSDPDLGTLEPGALIADRYRVLHKIGEGGMGIVYACEDSVLIREVAVKLMLRSVAADPQLSERLLREARLAAQLRKHVAQVFDCGTLVTGEPYIVMERLHGRDLDSMLRDTGPLSPERLTAYMQEVCVGLAEAHEKGIIHRDLKPENLYCAEEPDGSTLIKIVDFGISKQVTSRRLRSQTNPSESVGSPQYMSPEQITTPSEVDSRTDIWSLGVSMFELLTGDVPFNGAGPAQVCAAVLTQPVPPFADYRNDVPPALEAIVLRCLKRDREQRFPDIGELAAALGAFSASDDASAVLAARSSTAGLPAPKRARRWLGALCAVAVVGACVAVLGLAVRGGRIRLPSANDVQRLPARISAWRVPFLAPTPQSETAPTSQLGPAAAPDVAVEERPLAPAAATKAVVQEVRGTLPTANVQRSLARPIPAQAPVARTPAQTRAPAYAPVEALRASPQGVDRSIQPGDSVPEATIPVEPAPAPPSDDPYPNDDAKAQ